MIKAQHPACNHVLGAPKGWDQKELPCDALPVTMGIMEGGIPCVISYWKPTPTELLELNNGGFVQLTIIGNSMQPVMLDTTY